LLLAYCTLFYLFTVFLLGRLGEVSNVPAAFAAAGDYGTTQLIYSAASFLGWLFGLSILAYFVWNAIDVWGLEVWVSDSSIRVVNQILGNRLRKWSGVGALEMEDIQEIHPGPTVTRLCGSKHEIRFSPVEHLDRLAATLTHQAVNANIVEK
jgi:hypothetical protein